MVLTWFSHNYQWHLDVHHPINWGSGLIVSIKISHHPITSSFPPGNCWVASWRLLHPLGRKWVCSLIPYGVVTVSCMIIPAKAAHCLFIYIYVYIYISRSFSKLVSVYNPHLFFLSVFLCSSIYIYLFDLFVKFLYDFSLYTVISSSTRTWYQNMVPEHACVACVASSSLSPSSPCCLKRAYCKRPAGFLSHPISIFRGTSGG